MAQDYYEINNENSKRMRWLAPVLWLLLLIVLGLAVWVLFYRNAGVTDESLAVRRGINLGLASEQNNETTAPENLQPEFDDGLGTPTSVENFDFDENEPESLVSVETFEYDINGDALPDQIIRSRYENGTAHWHYEYQVNLNLGLTYTDITPDGFRTIEGADCSLQKLRFVFNSPPAGESTALPSVGGKKIPYFQVIKIGRIWDETWDTATPATKTVYELNDDDELSATSTQNLPTVCDVRELF